MIRAGLISRSMRRLRLRSTNDGVVSGRVELSSAQLASKVAERGAGDDRGVVFKLCPGG